MMERARPVVGVIADDMTGALDTAARLAALAGPMALEITTHATQGRSFAISSNTREAHSAAEAARRVANLAPRLRSCDIAFKKIDSLLRGHPFAEIAAMMSASTFDRCLLAPAFPEQGRITLGGQQWLLDAEGQRLQVGPELVGALKAESLSAARTGVDVHLEAARVIVADATCEADLRQAVDVVQKLGGRSLYCGTAGLAGALAEQPPAAVLRPAEPILAIVGSPHPVSQAQIDMLSAVATADAERPGEDPATRLLRVGKNRLVYFSFEGAVGRAEAEERITSALRPILRQDPLPQSLLVVGGETLLSVAEIIAAEQIMTEGELEPGLPAGRIVGGPWSGLRLFSKSGAFGGSELLRKILVGNPPLKGPAASERFE